mmetsp:Transcript_8589/g.23981  ORF Transcript_8589/g.23981 Transcript_8589/m.23981 type:complete len:273 (-) Transcript_8589:1128-1946(-)
MAEKFFKCPWSTSNSCIVPAFSAWRLRTSASRSSREARLTRSTVGEAAQPTEAAPPPTMPKAASMEAAWDTGRRRRRSGDATIAMGSCFSAVSVGMPPFVPTSGESNCEARAQSPGSTWVLAWARPSTLRKNSAPKVARLYASCRSKPAPSEIKYMAGWPDRGASSCRARRRFSCAKIPKRGQPEARTNRHGISSSTVSNGECIAKAGNTEPAPPPPAATMPAGELSSGAAAKAIRDMQSLPMLHSSTGLKERPRTALSTKACKRALPVLAI